jgi:Papain family cysteine protease
MFIKFKSISLLMISLLFILASCVETTPPTSQKRPGTGLIPTDEKTLASLPFDDKLPRATKLPDSVDLSDKFPTPGNQGGQGSCVGWAAAYLKTYQEVVETGEDPDSIFFSPSFIYNQIKGGDSCDSGSQIDDALNLLSEQGNVSETRFAYKGSECDVLPNDELKLEAGPFKIASWRRANTQDPTELKRHLFNESPILIAFDADEAFFDVKAGDIYKDPPSKNAGLHAMVVVGYDNDKKAFKLINSWGTQWGDGGFGWVDYDTFVDKTPYGFVAQDLKSDSNVNKGKPVIESLDTSPSTVSAGEASTISWRVSGAKPVRLTLKTDTGITEDVSDMKEFELTNIQKNTIVTLEAENTQGTTSQSTAVYVGDVFKVLDFKTEPDGTSEIPFSTEDDENRVIATLNYEAELSSKYAGLRIWVIPQSKKDTTPDSVYEASDIITDTSGQILRYFAVKDTGAFSQTVDSLLIWVEGVIKDGNEGTARENREPFYSEYIDTEYIFKNP